MKIKFTTEPWAINCVNIVVGPYVVAQTPTNSRMDQANRRLIAAAPDLLATCLKIAEQAQQAIAKATGGEKQPPAYPVGPDGK